MNDSLENIYLLEFNLPKLFCVLNNLMPVNVASLGPAQRDLFTFYLANRPLLLNLSRDYRKFSKAPYQLH